MIQIVRDVVKYKSGMSIDRKDFSEVFSAYMVQRWASMYSDVNVEILNSTVNILYKTLNDEQQYKMMMEMLPSTGLNKRYIKAPKRVPKTKEDINLSAFFEESSKNINEILKYVLGDDKYGVLGDIIMAEFDDCSEDGTEIERDGIFVNLNMTKACWRSAIVLKVGPSVSDLITEGTRVAFPNDKGIKNVQTSSDGTVRNIIFINEERLFGVLAPKKEEVSCL